MLLQPSALLPCIILHFRHCIQYSNRAYNWAAPGFPWKWHISAPKWAFSLLFSHSALWPHLLLIIMRKRDTSNASATSTNSRRAQFVPKTGKFAYLRSESTFFHFCFRTHLSLMLLQPSALLPRINLHFRHCIQYSNDSAWAGKVKGKGWPCRSDNAWGGVLLKPERGWTY